MGLRFKLRGDFRDNLLLAFTDWTFSAPHMFSWHSQHQPERHGTPSPLAVRNQTFMDQFWLGKQPRKEVFIVADWFLFLEFTDKSQKAMFVHGPNIRSDTSRLAPGCSTWAWYIKESLWEGYFCRETYGSEPKVQYPISIDKPMPYFVTQNWTPITIGFHHIPSP